MQNPLRYLALDRTRYDHVTAVCLVSSVVAALLYDANGEFTLLAVLVAVTACVITLALFFYRRVSVNRETAVGTSPISSSSSVA